MCDYVDRGWDAVYQWRKVRSLHRGDNVLIVKCGIPMQ